MTLELSLIAYIFISLLLDPYHFWLLLKGNIILNGFRAVDSDGTL
jgi:hypothetical protein